MSQTLALLSRVLTTLGTFLVAQAAVYAACQMSELVKEALAGYAVTTFAFGQVTSQQHCPGNSTRCSVCQRVTSKSLLRKRARICS